jgi:predicted nucleic acid-binding protein
VPDLLDTNFISELAKARPHPGVMRYFLSRQPEELFISTVTLAELRFGISTLSNLQKQAHLTAWLNRDVRPLFLDRTLPITEAVMLRWRVLMAEGRKINHTYSPPDLILAATCLEHDLTLITRNTRDFKKVPSLQLFNPWEPIA